jgi:hypothetical protein
VVFSNKLIFYGEELLAPRPTPQAGDEVKGGWRKLHNEELHMLYFSPSIIRMIKSWRMIWAGHVA